MNGISFRLSRDRSTASTDRGRSDDQASDAHGSKPSTSTGRHQFDERVPAFNTPTVITIFGEQYQTSPCTFGPGDKPYWRYQTDILHPVEVTSVIPASPTKPQASYGIKVMASGYQTDCLHHDLFVPVDGEVIVDPNTAKTKWASIFDLKDHLSRGINANLTDEQLYRFNKLTQENFKATTFLTAMKTEEVQSDDLAAFELFYNSINIHLAAAHKFNVRYLPLLSQLSPSKSICDHVYPPVTYSERARAAAHLDFVGTLLHKALCHSDIVSKAPKLAFYLSGVVHGTTDGWSILDHLAKSVMPSLGALNVDIDAQIKELTVSNGMQLQTFLAKANKIQQIVTISGVNPSPNALLHQFFAEIMKCDNIAPIMATKNHEFMTFLAQNGYSAIYKKESVASLAIYLRLGNAPGTLSVRGAPPAPTMIPSRYGPSKFNPPVLAGMNFSPELPAPDDGTVADDAVPEKNSTAPFDLDTDGILRAAVPSALSALGYDTDKLDPKLGDLVFSAMQRGVNKAPREQCQACLGRHSTDRCFARGAAFQPEWMQKNVRQVNATLGDKPKVPLNPATKPPPTTSTWGLQHKSVELPAPSSSPVDAATEMIQWNIEGFPDEISPSLDSETSHLQLHSISTATDFNVTLQQLSNQIEQFSTSNTISVDPKIAVLDIKDYDPTNSAKHRDVTTPLELSDYSVYGNDEQVKA